MRIILNLTLPLFALAVANMCGAQEAHGAFKRYSIFVDWSPSITSAQRVGWISDADKVLTGLKPGDAVAVYPIHANTFAAKALFEAESLPFDEDLGLDEQLRRHQVFKQMRDGLRTALHNALFSPKPTLETDLFGALDRCRTPDRGRRMVAVLFSDMLQSSSRDIDLETFRLTEANIPGVVLRVGESHRWANGMLAGARVYCILPGLNGQKAILKNDPALLRLFWETLFKTLGAQLERWDTQF